MSNDGEYKILGKNRRTYVRVNGSGYARDEASTVTAVVVAGDIGDYAVYIGMGSPEFVARHGDKLAFAEAKLHFPGLDEKRYRL